MGLLLKERSRLSPWMPQICALVVFSCCLIAVMAAADVGESVAPGVAPHAQGTSSATQAESCKRGIWQTIFGFGATMLAQAVDFWAATSLLVRPDVYTQIFLTTSMLLSPFFVLNLYLIQALEAWKLWYKLGRKQKKQQYRSLKIVVGCKMWVAVPARLAPAMELDVHAVAHHHQIVQEEKKMPECDNQIAQEEEEESHDIEVDRSHDIEVEDGTVSLVEVQKKAGLEVNVVIKDPMVGQSELIVPSLMDPYNKPEDEDQIGAQEESDDNIELQHGMYVTVSGVNLEEALEVNAVKDQMAEYKFLELYVSGKQALIEAGLMPVYNKLKYLPRNRSIAVILAAAQAAGYLMDKHARVRHKLGVSPLEVIGAYLSVIVLAKAITCPFACIAFQRPMLFYLKNEEEWRELKSKMHSISTIRSSSWGSKLVLVCCNVISVAVLLLVNLYLGYLTGKYVARVRENYRDSFNNTAVRIFVVSSFVSNFFASVPALVQERKCWSFPLFFFTTLMLLITYAVSLVATVKSWPEFSPATYDVFPRTIAHYLPSHIPYIG